MYLLRYFKSDLVYREDLSENVTECLLKVLVLLYIVSTLVNIVYKASCKSFEGDLEGKYTIIKHIKLLEYNIPN